MKRILHTAFCLYFNQDIKYSQSYKYRSPSSEAPVNRLPSNTPPSLSERSHPLPVFDTKA